MADVSQSPPSQPETSEKQDEPDTVANAPSCNESLESSLDPFKWPIAKKWTVTLVACYATFIVGINSTSITAAATPINEEFNVSDESFLNSYWPVTSWNTGAAIAPMVILPLMENYGVRAGYLINYAVFTLFVLPQALAPNFATLIVTRFIAGCCGGVIQDVMDGIIADIWPDAFQRSLPVTIYVFSLLLGVTLGPVFGGAITTYLDWRWIFYIQLIMYGISAPIIFLTFKETRGPVLAAKHNKSTEKEPSANTSTTSPPLTTILWDAISRPTYLLLTEPVVFFFTLLSALSYGLPFIATQSTTLVFSTLYSFPEPTTALLQSSLAIGEVLGLLACLAQNRIYATAPLEPNSTTPLPETRLYVAVPGTLLGLAGGLFVYGWTSYPFIPWPAPCVGLALTGFGSVTVMQPVMMYVTDAYAKYAASASAAVCFGENIFAAVLPLASYALYTGLGFRWGSSLLGFVALALGVAPVVLIWKGEAVRRRSKFMVVAGYD